MAAPDTGRTVRDRLAAGPQVGTIGLWRLPGFITAGVCMLVSGALLFMAQKHIPIGTAYAVWTGIGAAGTFLAGALLFGDTVQPLRLAGIALIIAGVALLKLA